MHKGSKVKLTDDHRIRVIEQEFHRDCLPPSRLHVVVVGSIGTVVANRPRLDDHVLVKFPGYGSVLSLRGSEVEAVV